VFYRRGLNGGGRRLGRRALTICAIVLGAACSPAQTPADATGLQVSEARVRALIPGQSKTVGYFTAHNAGSEALVLTGARSDAVRAIEIHTTQHDGDMVRMRRLDDVVIAAGETVRFEPGGRHLMLFDAADLGDALEIVLLGAGGDEVHVTFRVMPAGEI
jgi:periplasmic copper chaperone A